ncbi:tRNA (adenosine(37)-N6)-threonylcarbamoyltransferase complex ATPase subunit type 1 TsaE [Desulforhabdus amnigena]|uniref:tRNA threonylcarbamoyladenosine biosynthesis protein TsaE n=1 Tax=Desulforhabdus amnigena TaxID=40218 RepID=A0A9W6FUH3_9BACT|nr:tRNA (adenosine(37)-N6)-threonylcarbamoyltransferase complex ATPase subunit type 1 TsaE [Desulforhabdus amnigena]GLI35120.1 tRNA (adenosine(37)-N6)-threonylcarbamoyltransferase complex ATPase subunit type 1 TsaE [Desulforhabdus amnigena]
MPDMILHSPSEAYSFELGFKIGTLVEAGDILTLWGDLGAGKTFLTRGIARGLGVPPQVPVTSPTFTFINEYEGRLHLYHLDLYRLADPDELETLPWKEALFGKGVAVIEWPERLGEELPEERWDIRIEVTGDESRTIILQARGKSPETRMEKWKRELASCAGTHSYSEES